MDFHATGKSLISNLHLKYAEKTWNETFQLVRRSMEKYRSDRKPSEPLVRCLKRLHEALDVSSLSALVSRLEMIAKQRGMGSHLSPTETTCYLTADLFYVEVLLLAGGQVEDVKVAQHGEAPVSSESLLGLLRSKKFQEFSVKLEGIASLYNVPGDNENKIKLYTALQHLGKDLQKISHLPRALKEYDTQLDMILNGRIGCLTVGREGCPMSIRFYVSPSDVLLGLSGPEGDSVGQGSLVTVGPSQSTHKLQMTSLIPQPPQLDSQGGPVFCSINELSYEVLPAHFLLKLQPPLPMLSSFIKKLSRITDVAVPETDLQWAPFPQLLTSSPGERNGEETLDREEPDAYFRVPLPDGVVHSYVLPQTAWGGEALRGSVVGSVPFTHPAHVPALLEVLRHQCAINALLNSCVAARQSSPGSLCDLYCEVLPESDSSLSVTFTLTDSDSLAVVLMNVQDSRQMTCSLFGAVPKDPSMDEYISKVLRRCLSIPVTMRALSGRLAKSIMIPPSATITGDDSPALTAIPVACDTTSSNAPETTSSHTPETTSSHSPETTSSHTPETTSSNAPETTSTNAPETTSTNAPETTSTNAPETTSSNAPEPDGIHSCPSVVISQDAPGADATPVVSASEYYLMSVATSLPVSDASKSPPVNPYPCATVGVYPSHWIANSNHFSELI